MSRKHPNPAAEAAAEETRQREAKTKRDAIQAIYCEITDVMGNVDATRLAVILHKLGYEAFTA